MTTPTEIVAYLLSDKCPKIKQATAIHVTVEGQVFPAARYRSHHEYRVGMDVVAKGERKAGEAYTQEGIYVVGLIPKLIDNGRIIAFTIPGESHEWFITGCSPIQKAPLGSFFVLMPWTEKNPIDHHAIYAYKRVAISIAHSSQQSHPEQGDATAARDGQTTCSRCKSQATTRVNTKFAGPQDVCVDCAVAVLSDRQCDYIPQPPQPGGILEVVNLGRAKRAAHAAEKGWNNEPATVSLMTIDDHRPLYAFFSLKRFYETTTAPGCVSSYVNVYLDANGVEVQANIVSETRQHNQSLDDVEDRGLVVAYVRQLGYHEFRRSQACFE